MTPKHPSRIVFVYPYKFEFWNKYTKFCRKLADEAHVTMRELDRALWSLNATV